MDQENLSPQLQSQKPVVPSSHLLISTPLILIVLFLFLIVGVGGYYLGKRQTNQPTTTVPTIVSILSPTPVPTIVQEDTVNWKTYSDTKYGFEIRYPANYSSQVQGPNDAQSKLNAGQQISGTAAPSYETIVFTNSSEGNLNFQLEVFHTNKLPLTPVGYHSGIYLSSVQCDIRYLGSEPNFQQIKTNGMNVLKVSVDKSDQKVACYYLKNKDSNLLVFSTAVIDNQVIFDQINQTLTKILSTFKFLDQLPTGTGYKCPVSEYVDCMPVVGDGVKFECTPAYLNWAKQNCPNFKGAAL